MNLKAIPSMLSMIPSLARGVTLEDLDRIKRIVRTAFPSVKQVSPKTLSEWQLENPNILLIDVRSPREFDVSHLRSAINARSPAEIVKAIIERKPSKTVLYCSVGFRSSQLTTKLPAGLGDEIYNLEGSIFQWANEGRALFRNDIPVSSVHPYGRKWGGLLIAERRAKT